MYLNISPFVEVATGSGIFCQNGKNDGGKKVLQIANTLAQHLSFAGEPCIVSDQNGERAQKLWKEMGLPQSVKTGDRFTYNQRDVLNADTCARISEQGRRSMLVLFGNGSRDAERAFRFMWYSGQRADNLDVLALGSPVSMRRLQRAAGSVGANVIGKVSDWRDPVPHLKVWLTLIFSLVGCIFLGIHFIAMMLLVYYVSPMLDILTPLIYLVTFALSCWLLLGVKSDIYLKKPATQRCLQTWLEQNAVTGDR